MAAADLPIQTAPRTSTYAWESGDIEIVNLGPLTTAWSIPKSCTETTTTYTGNFLYVYDVMIFDNSNCNPPAAGADPAVQSSYGGYLAQQIYAPGNCPLGWGTAATLDSLWGYPFSSLGTSLYMCCPDKFVSDASSSCSGCYNGMLCTSGITSGLVVTNVWAMPPAGTTIGPSPVLQDITMKAPTQVIAAAILVALPIGSTLLTLSPASTTSSSVPSETTVSTGTTGTKSPVLTSKPSDSSYTSPTSSATPLSSPGSSGLSTGAKVGIAIGVVGLFLIVVGAIIVFLFKRRRKRAAAELEAIERAPVHELGTDANTHELQTKSNTHEVAGEKGPAPIELDAGPGVLRRRNTRTSDALRISQVGDLDDLEHGSWVTHLGGENPTGPTSSHEHDMASSTLKDDETPAASTGRDIISPVSPLSPNLEAEPSWREGDDSWGPGSEEGSIGMRQEDAAQKVASLHERIELIRRQKEILEIDEARTRRELLETWKNREPESQP